MTATRRPVVAAFDVDGTLTTRDCVAPFLYRARGLRAGLALVRHPLSVSRALAHRDRDSIKALVCTAFAGMHGEEVDVLGATFAREIETPMAPTRHVRATPAGTGSSVTRSSSSPPPSTRISSRSDRASARRGSSARSSNATRNGVLTGTAGRPELPWPREGPPTRAAGSPRPGWPMPSCGRTATRRGTTHSLRAQTILFGSGADASLRPSDVRSRQSATREPPCTKNSRN